MAKEYLESTISGNSYVRARKVIIDYQLDQLPSITFVRERIMRLNSEMMKTPISNISKAYDEAAEIALRNPNDGTLTGNVITQAQVFQALYSLFYQLSVEVDT